jgi:hypothetical protein
MDESIYIGGGPTTIGAGMMARPPLLALATAKDGTQEKRSIDIFR